MYATCWIPAITVLIYMVYDPEGFSVGSMLSAYVFTHFHCAVNPFLYAFNIKGARKSAIHLLKRIICMVSGPQPRPVSFISTQSKSPRTSKSSLEI